MNRSSIMLSSLENYYMGGTTAIVEEIRRCGYFFEQWFTNPLPGDPWKLCPTFYGMSPVDFRDDLPPPALPSFDLAPDVLHEINSLRSNSGHVALYPNSSQSLFGHSLAIGRFLGPTEGDVLAVSAPFEVKATNTFQSDTGAIHFFKVSDLIVQMNNESALLPSRKIDLTSLNQSSSMDHVYPFGSQMISMSLLGQDILVVAHPGMSAVKFYSAGKMAFQIYWKDASTLYGSSGLKLVGETMASGDLDQDGVEDLIVGAPKKDDDKAPQRGQVFVFYGSTLETILKSVLEIGDTKGWRAQSIPVEEVLHSVIPPPVLDEEGYEQFGSQISIGSTKDSVTGLTLQYASIASAGLGEIYIYNLTSDAILMNTITLSRPTGGVFGDSLLLSTKNGWLFAGISTESSSNICTQCGQVNVYKISLADNAFRSHFALQLEPKRSLTSDSFDRFGSHGTLTKDTLYISSPFASKDKGKIWSIALADVRRLAEVSIQQSALKSSVKQNLFNLFAKNRLAQLFTTNRFKSQKVQLKSMLKGRQTYSRFGHCLRIGTDPSDSESELLFVSEPYLGSDVLSSTAQQLKGCVNIYKVGIP